jgi:eukaryotic-like serine/threonine-protein kinase
LFTPGPGAVVEDRYELTRVIGRGGMGEIWEAYDRQLEGPCAIKFILQHLVNDKEVRSRFGREAKAVARLRTPHAVHIFSVGEQEQTPYLAMELLQGETLYGVLERNGRLSQGITLSVIEQISEALALAHEAGIVHRDLKPDNVWLCSGNRVFVKVLDFGVAKVGLGGTATLRTATGSLVGTPNYMSPEQARGNRNVDHRSDLWSLAVIALECLTGKRPFESAGLGDLLIQIVASPIPRLTEFAPELPPGLQHWMDKALERDPNQRFQSAAALVEGLRPYLVEAGMRTPDDTFRPVQSSTAIGTLLRRMHPNPRKQLLRKGLWVAGAVGIALSMGAVGLLLGGRSDAPSSASQAPAVASEALLPAPPAAPPPADSALQHSAPQPAAAPPVRPTSTAPAARVRVSDPSDRPAKSKSSVTTQKKAESRAARPEPEDEKPKRPKPNRLPQLLDDKPATAPTKDDGRLF